MKSAFMIFVLVFILICSSILFGTFELSCKSPVIGISGIGGEIKYYCEVKNTGASAIELQYEVNAINPLDSSVEANFHPQPANLYIPAGQSRYVSAFESFPKISSGQYEASYERVIYIVPRGKTKSDPEAKSATITTIINNTPLSEDSGISGFVYDSQTKKPVKNARINLEYIGFSRTAYSRNDGFYSISIPSFEYMLTIQHQGHEFYAKTINLSGTKVSLDVYLHAVREKGVYNLTKKLTLESGAWGGIWRAAISGNEKYIAVGSGGQQTKQGSLSAFAYLFDSSGNQLWKKEMQTEIRGMDISSDGSHIALSIGYGSGFEKLYLYDRNGGLVWKKFTIDDSFQEVKISNNGKYLAVGNSLAGNVYLLNTADGTELWKGFAEGQVRAIRFYDDDSHIIVGSGSGYIYIFDINGNLKWKAYVHSWPYGFIATGNNYLATGGHMGFLHFFDKNGNELWNYETYGGFRWADIGNNFTVAGTRSELVFLDGTGNVVWKDSNSMSGMLSQDGRFILTGDQGGQVQLRNLNGTILWQYPEASYQVYGKDVRFSYITKDNSRIISSTKTGDLYFFEGNVSGVTVVQPSTNQSVDIIVPFGNKTQNTDSVIQPSQPPQLPAQPPLPPEPQVPITVYVLGIIVLVVVALAIVLVLKRKK